MRDGCLQMKEAAADRRREGKIVLTGGLFLF